MVAPSATMCMNESPQAIASAALPIHIASAISTIRCLASTTYRDIRSNIYINTRFFAVGGKVFGFFRCHSLVNCDGIQSTRFNTCLSSTC